MKRDLVVSPQFARAAKRIAKKSPKAVKRMEKALEMLQGDAHDPRLKTHKLTGKLAGSWACRAGYDLRIIFSFVKLKKEEAILLETVGTHDEAY